MVPAVALLASGGTLLLAGCGPRAATPASAAVQPAVVEYVTLRPASAGGGIELPGVVAPSRAATITAPLGGQLRFLADEGARVGMDARLAVLEAPGLPEQVSAARASVDASERRRAGARTGVRQAVAEGSLAVATLEQTLKAAEAERDRRQEMLAESEVQARTEPARLQAQVEAAEARVRLLKSGERDQRIKQLEAGLEVARAELQVASGQLKRNRDLYGQGYVSRDELEGAVLTVQRARANVTKHQEELTLQKEGAHPEAIAEAQGQAEVARQSLKAAEGLQRQVAQRRAELAEAEAGVAKAARNLESARSNRLAVTRAQDEAAASDAESRRSRMEFQEVQARLLQSVVRAPFAGQVVRRRARPGENVTLGAPLLEVVDPTGLHFEATVSDAEVARLHPGQSLEVVVPAASARPLPARIAEIILSADQMKRAYRVKLMLPSSAALRPGMVGTARVRTAASGGGLRLPVTAFRRHFPAEGRAEVIVLEEGRASVREVRLGASDGGEAAVTSGLRPGERVVVSDPAHVAPGAPVQAREVSRP